jgi:ribose transport system ATP-binding protein
VGDVLLRVENVHKHFGGIAALKGVSLEVRRGEILALVGENGAGKSTLAKIVSGVISRDSGVVELDGVPVHFPNTTAAREAGVSIVLQEFNLIPDLSVAENVFLMAPETFRAGFWLDRRSINRRTEELIRQTRIDLKLDPSRRISGLSVAEQQLVEVLKAMWVRSRLLILDEPTAALTKQETAKLFDLIRKLRADGLTVIFVSHRIEEVFAISDRIVVFRDGEKVREFVTAQTQPRGLITAMVGRDVGNMYAIRKRNPPGEVLVDVRGLSRGSRVMDCSFQLRRGEIVGLSGLVGAGRTELVRALFGADRADSGSVTIRGRVGIVRSPAQSIHAGTGMVPEDRKKHGLLVDLPIYQNITLTYHVRSRGFWISRKRELSMVDRKVEELRIKIAGSRKPVTSLSGGNQQKVVIAKWLLNEPDVLLMDEPTRGIDIGAKFDVYALIDSLAARGVAVLLVSSELPEIIALSDRILVMKAGRIVKELGHDEATEELILSYCAEGDHQNDN